MVKTASDLLAAELRERAEAYRAGAPDHPALERLIAYHEGGLAPDEEDRLQAHLIGCRDCAALLLELGSFVESCEEPTEGAADFETAAAWKALRARLPERPARTRAWMAAAAALCAVTLGLSIWVGRQHSRLGSLEQEIDRLDRPRATAILDLASTPTVRGGPLVQTLELAPGTELVTLVLGAAPASPDRFSTFRLQLFDVRGEEIWSFEGLSPGPHGTFDLSLPRRLLPDGTYRLDLSGLHRDEQHPLRQYHIVLETGG